MNKHKNNNNSSGKKGSSSSSSSSSYSKLSITQGEDKTMYRYTVASKPVDVPADNAGAGKTTLIKEMESAITDQNEKVLLVDEGPLLRAAARIPKGIIGKGMEAIIKALPGSVIEDGPDDDPDSFVLVQDTVGPGMRNMEKPSAAENKAEEKEEKPFVPFDVEMVDRETIIRVSEMRLVLVTLLSGLKGDYADYDKAVKEKKTRAELVNIKNTIKSNVSMLLGYCSKIANSQKWPINDALAVFCDLRCCCEDKSYSEAERKNMTEMFDILNTTCFPGAKRNQKLKIMPIVFPLPYNKIVCVKSEGADYKRRTVEEFYKCYCEILEFRFCVFVIDAYVNTLKSFDLETDSKKDMYTFMKEYAVIYSPFLQEDKTVNSTPELDTMVNTSEFIINGVHKKFAELNSAAEIPNVDLKKFTGEMIQKMADEFFVST